MEVMAFRYDNKKSHIFDKGRFSSWESWHGAEHFVVQENHLLTKCCTENHIVFTCSVLQLLVTGNIVPGSLILATPMKVIHSSEMSALQ
jgi:hypothetical protein